MNPQPNDNEYVRVNVLIITFSNRKVPKMHKHSSSDCNKYSTLDISYYSVLVIA